MSILRDFEQRLEGAVEGFFARAFRSGLQPIELAKAVQRYATNYQQVGLEGVVVPNVYRFQLSEEDLERFGGYVTPMQRELASVVTRTAAERDWVLAGPVRIEFQPSEDVRVGTYELRGKIEAPEDRPRPAQAPAPVRVADEDAPVPAAARAPDTSGVATTVLPTRRPGATLRRLDEPGARPVGVREGMMIGRLRESDLAIDDPSVSRRHARITYGDGAWAIEDLGSTNGVRLNGDPVERAALQHGDRIDLGSVRLAFSLDEPEG
jgi:hypothetical protein